MSAKNQGKKKTRMPRKRSAKVLADKNEIIRGQQATMTLHIMREMDVVPLGDPNDGIEYHDAEDTSKRRKIDASATGRQRKSDVQEHDGENLYHKTAGKASRDDFVLFRKQCHPQPTDLDHFAKLSDEIILHVFQWLPKPILVKCSAVCKRFRNLSYDETLWRKYDFGRRLVKPRVLEILLRRGVTIFRLAMSEIKSPVFSDNFMQGSRWYCKLQYLDLSMVTISGKELADLLYLCCHLKKLSVENCALNEDCCRNIAQNKLLTVLNMAMCSGLTSSGLLAICANCDKLKEWNLAWTDISCTCMDELLPCIPTQMERLNISGYRESLCDDGLTTVVERCPNIKELDISDCPLLSGVSFSVIVKTLLNLEHLHTSRSYNIPTDSNRLLKGMKKFKNLEIFRTLTDEALASLREYMPNIQINQNVFSTIARPTTGIRRTSIWGLRVRD